MIQTNTQKINWLIDATLFSAFLIVFLLDLTGLSLHQWLGVAVIFLAGYHLLAHWNWFEAVTGRFFGRTSKQARLYYVLDAVLMLGFYLILLTGLIISTWLSLPLQNFDAWRDIHVWISIITLLLVVLKIGTHSRWIIHVAKRYLFPSPKTLELGLEPASVHSASERRDFLKLMGVVGLASVIAMGSALHEDQDVLANDTNLDPGSITSKTTTQDNSISSSSSSSCFVRCNKGCSYPGHCRRYVDSNGNNLCDLGECI